MRSECVIAAWCPAQPSASWEVWNDPGRTFTMLHPANTMDNLQAASAQGPTLGYNCGKWAVTDGCCAFRRPTFFIYGLYSAPLTFSHPNR